jgi:hypothetical protein
MTLPLQRESIFIYAKHLITQVLKNETQTTNLEQIKVLSVGDDKNELLSEIYERSILSIRNIFEQDTKILSDSKKLQINPENLVTYFKCDILERLEKILQKKGYLSTPTLSLKPSIGYEGCTIC